MNSVQKFCSKECRRESGAISYPIPTLSNELNISRSTVGALCELRVAVDLMTRGFHVFRALSPACPSDLVIMRDGTCLLIEVKTAYMRNGKLQRPTIRDGHIFDILAMVTTEQIIYDPSLPA